jgi:AcrR family transcriptional regulator
LNDDVCYAGGVPSPDTAPRPPRTDRRAEIVQVAYRLIAERGLEGLRFSDVAREAGINNGTLLYYFASKEALIQAVGAYLVEQFSQISQASLPPDDDAPLDAVRELRLEFADARERLYGRVSVVYTELLARAQRDETVATLLRDIDAGWRGWLISILERGRAQGRFAAELDVDLVATTIMASIRGVGMQALVMQDPGKAGSAMEAVAALIERWVVAP